MGKDDKDKDAFEDWVPKYPKDTENYAAVQRWKQNMTGYLAEHGYLKTAIDGNAPKYPPGISSLADGAIRVELQRKEDRYHNGKVHGIMLRATRGAVPSLYQQLLKHLTLTWRTRT